MQQQEQDARSDGSSSLYLGRDASSQSYTPLTFIDIPNPEAVRDRGKVRTARAHSVTVALARKRLKAKEDGSNFKLQTFRAGRSDSNNRRRPDLRMITLPAPSAPIGLSSIDPFETLAVNARRLTTLFHQKSSLCAGEPVFSINDAIHFQNLESIFGSGLCDGALTAALSLTMSYAASGWRMNNECIEFNLIAMQQIRRKLSDPDTAASCATIGTILLLLGNAYRLGELRSAETHLHGLRMLLRLCSEHDIRLSPALKRAIYWQDLFTSVFLGTDRIVGYESFYPSHQTAVKYASQSIRQPSGFVKSAHLLGSDFMNVAADVATLYADRKKLLASDDRTESPYSLDDILAQLEGRIHALRQATSDDMILCCVIAIHLCVYGFWNDVWNAALIPRELSTKLLHHLRCCQRREFKDDDLFLWLVYLGKAFAIDAWVRSGLDELWLKRHGNFGESTFPPRDDTKHILSKFIWSDVLYSEENGWFWERIRE